MADPIKTAQSILAQVSSANPRLPSDEDLGELARAYLALCPPPGTKPRLHTLGNVLVTAAAAADFRRVETVDGAEAARRELTETMLAAKEATGGSWIAHARASGLDITAKVSIEGRLAVVTHCHARPGRRR